MFRPVFLDLGWDGFYYTCDQWMNWAHLKLAGNKMLLVTYRSVWWENYPNSSCCQTRLRVKYLWNHRKAVWPWKQCCCPSECWWSSGGESPFWGLISNTQRVESQASRHAVIPVSPVIRSEPTSSQLMAVSALLTRCSRWEVGECFQRCKARQPRPLLGRSAKVNPEWICNNCNNFRHHREDNYSIHVCVCCEAIYTFTQHDVKRQ